MITNEERASIANLLDGAIIEQADGELEKIIRDIQDPNKDPKTVRKLTINLTFKPKPNRQDMGASFLMYGQKTKRWQV